MVFTPFAGTSFFLPWNGTSSGTSARFTRKKSPKKGNCKVKNNNDHDRKIRILKELEEDIRGVKKNLNAAAG